MKKIKYLFLILVVILFSGCSVKYNLNIDNDLSVTEKVEATEKEYNVKTNTGMDSNNSVKYLFDLYKRDGIKASISSKVENSKIIAISSASHDSLDDYVDNFTSDIFEEVKLSKSGNIYTLLYKQNLKLSSTSSTAPIYDDIEVNITVPFKVTKHNADKVYKNTYTWYLKKDQELRNIKFTFDTSKIHNYTTLDFGLFKINVRYNVVIITAVILIIGTIIGIVYVNNKKNNKF